MASFEQACSDTEKAAEATRKSAARVVSQARALVNAARTGNITRLGRCQKELNEGLTALQQDVSNAGSCWPFSDEEEQGLLGSEYADELRAAAATRGLKIQERDGELISYPSIVRVIPAERAVRVDKKKVSTTRPSYLVRILWENQRRSSSFSSQRFLESLYAVYNEVAGETSQDILPDGGRVVPLARIYKLMTSLPGSAREYGRSDFARDLYILESKGPRRTRNGTTVSFSSSTGARKRSSDLFSIIGPDGDSAEYYGIRFSKDDG